jgi:predicted acyl esterase
MDAGLWCGHGRPGDMAPDQRSEDGRSLTFTSAPLTKQNAGLPTSGDEAFTSQPAAEQVEILGFPQVELTLSADQPIAMLVVRLCDVSPTGSSLLVTRGLLNLNHRNSHEFPEPLEPGKEYTVTITLNPIAHALPSGHRWRVAISPTYWPWSWPSPKPITLTVRTGQSSSLTLPIRPSQESDAYLPPFLEPEGSPPLDTELLGPAARHQKMEYDAIENRYTQFPRCAFGVCDIREASPACRDSRGTDSCREG